MKAVRLCFRAPTAHFAVPYVISDRKTYPIPPYSTAIGIICNILAKRDRIEIEDFLKSEFLIAVVGDYESIEREYTWYRNLSAAEHKRRFPAGTRKLMGEIEHPGGQSPVRIDILVDSKFCIYVHAKDEILQDIVESFESGNYISHLHAGRAEDIVSWASVFVVDLEKKEVFHTGGYTWIPSPENSMDDSFEYERMFEGIGGIRQKIGTVYRTPNKTRIFERVDVKLYKGSIPMLSPFELFRAPADDENPFFGSIPIFFSKVVRA